MIHSKICTTFTHVLAYKTHKWSKWQIKHLCLAIFVFSFFIIIIHSSFHHYFVEFGNNALLHLPFPSLSVVLEFLGVSSASANCTDVAVSPVASWSGDTVGVFSSTLLMLSVDPSDPITCLDIFLSMILSWNSFKLSLIIVSANPSVILLNLTAIIRWFKFTLKPHYRITRDKLRLAIWDTSFWTFWLKFGHKGPWDILRPILVIFEICQFLMIPGPFEYFSENGCTQKIKVFSMKELSLPPYWFSFRRTGP